MITQCTLLTRADVTSGLFKVGNGRQTASLKILVLQRHLNEFEVTGVLTLSPTHLQVPLRCIQFLDQVKVIYSTPAHSQW